MAKNDGGARNKYKYDLDFSGQYLGSFQEFDGPASGKLKPGQREFTLKMGLVRGDAARTLIEWYKKIAEGHARPRNVEVSDTSKWTSPHLKEIGFNSLMRLSYRLDFTLQVQ